MATTYKTSKEEVITFTLGIIKQYQGMKLTVRQIYYRLVAGQHIENSMNSYKRVVSILTDARREGKIPYTAIEDRTRSVKAGEDNQESAKDYFQGYLNYIARLDSMYSMPLWWGQKTVPVVLVEKEALASVFEQVTDKLGVDLVVCRGYPSLTLLYDIAQRYEHRMDTNHGIERVVGLYFGDFDPSGTDIERSVGDNLQADFGVELDLKRVALTQGQVRQYNLPPAPAKVTDSRTQAFAEKYGEAIQVELDAIDPRELQRLIRERITGFYTQQGKDERAAELAVRRHKIKTWVQESVKADYIAKDEDEEDEDLE